ncbi:entry/fusion imv membrane protein [Pteropox virus]|uniref:Entry/fusion imv membrane protein n=1 Tax=Pteropox virus TaxID=1873698 RepID=A0A1B1MRH5_9POXV|nr:entry/fusion imv membrane protein [Pteropox virus]ANS71153.1 entry/fusion imv membrane protein [Pteropox virus]
MSTTVNLSPVFVAPTFEHSLLRADKYIFIELFEFIVVVFLVYVFFKDEIVSMFTPVTPINELDKYKDTYLTCYGNKLYIISDNKQLPALSLNFKQIEFEGCSTILRNINGSRTVRISDVLNRQ